MAKTPTSRALRAATAAVALLALLGLAAATPARAGEAPEPRFVFAKVKPFVEGSAVLPLKHGTVNVMLYGTQGFDPTQVNLSNLRAGHNGTEAAPIASRLIRNTELQSYDLLVRFRIDDMGLQCGDGSVRITGRTVLNEQPFMANPKIVTRLCKPPI